MDQVCRGRWGPGKLAFYSLDDRKPREGFTHGGKVIWVLLWKAGWGCSGKNGLHKGTGRKQEARGEAAVGTDTRRWTSAEGRRVRA